MRDGGAKKTVRAGGEGVAGAERIGGQARAFGGFAARGQRFGPAAFEHAEGVGDLQGKLAQVAAIVLGDGAGDVGLEPEDKAAGGFGRRDGRGGDDGRCAEDGDTAAAVEGRAVGIGGGQFDEVCGSEDLTFAETGKGAAHGAEMAAELEEFRAGSVLDNDGEVEVAPGEGGFAGGDAAADEDGADEGETEKRGAEDARGGAVDPGGGSHGRGANRRSASSVTRRALASGSRPM